MVLKVRLILGEFTFFVGGNLCNQFVCVPSFITNKLPFSKKISINNVNNTSNEQQQQQQQQQQQIVVEK